MDCHSLCKVMGMQPTRILLHSAFELDDYHVGHSIMLMFHTSVSPIVLSIGRVGRADKNMVVSLILFGSFLFKKCLHG